MCPDFSALQLWSGCRIISRMRESSYQVLIFHFLPLLLKKNPKQLQLSLVEGSEKRRGKEGMAALTCLLCILCVFLSTYCGKHNPRVSGFLIFSFSMAHATTNPSGLQSHLTAAWRELTRGQPRAPILPLISMQKRLLKLQLYLELNFS